MEKIASLSLAERELMGAKGREKVEQEFDEQIVVKKYLNYLSEILALKIYSPDLKNETF
jgi:glycosyltransferase involved in cell wall biosynthesis